MLVLVISKCTVGGHQFCDFKNRIRESYSMSRLWLNEALHTGALVVEEEAAVVC